MTRRPTPHRKPRVPVLLAAALIPLACGGGEAADDAAPPRAAATASGYGAYEPLLNLAVVVEATVVDHEGPVAVANEFGGVDYPGRSERAEDWTTPDGLPVIVFGDLDVIAAADESADLTESAARLSREGAELRVLAPVGFYRRGARYQLWLKPNREIGAMSYLAFDADGRLVEGLGLPGADRSYDRLSEYTGEDRTASLLAVARELRSSPGALTDLLELPTSGTSAPAASSLP